MWRTQTVEQKLVKFVGPSKTNVISLRLKLSPYESLTAIVTAQSSPLNEVPK